MVYFNKGNWRLQALGARFVEFMLVDADVVFGDHYFDVLPGGWYGLPAPYQMARQLMMSHGH